MAATGMAHGTVVQLHGLKSKPELNGQYSVILEAQNATELAELEKSGRVKVAAHPKTLSLKPECVRCVGAKELDSIDWSFADVTLPGERGFATARAAIKHSESRCGHVHRCDEFADILWSILSQDMPKPPRNQVNKEMLERILNEMIPHCFHFFALDQIGHHFVIEKRAGRARVFQSYIRDFVQESGRKIGYSAREWVTGRPEKRKGGTLNKGMLEARKRWGGEAPLDYTQLEMLIELILQLQSCAGEIAELMYHQLPIELVEQEKEFRAQVRKQREADCTEGLKETSNTPIALWASALANKPDQMTMYSPPNSPIIISMKDCDFVFEIPSALAGKFCDLYQNLTGEQPSTSVYLKILHFREWSTTFRLHETGQPSAVGWAVCHATIPH